jgi:hypothetical protein
MGLIQILDSEHQIPLRSRLRVGRASDGGLVLPHPSVSRDHALLAWSGLVWEVRDLGSQNGTFVEGARLPAGGRAELGPQALVTFASGGAVRLVDDAAPQPLALAGDVWISGRLGVLELLGEATDGTGDLSIWSDRSGAWWLEDAQGERGVQDGEVVALQARRWTLSLPDLTSIQPTARDPVGLPAIPLEVGLFDPQERVIRRDQRVISLSPTEARLLSYLAERPETTVSHRELLSQVWGYHQAVESRTVYVTVGRLRHKIERDPADPHHLIAVPGLGYRWRPLAP